MSHDPVDWSNVQGLVLSGYKRLRCAAYLLFRFTDPEPNRLSREWLWRLIQRVINAEQGPRKGSSGPWVGDAPIYAHNLAILHALTRMELPRPEVWALNVAFTPTGLAALGVTAAELGRFASEFQQGMAPATTPRQSAHRRSNLLGDVGASAPEHWSWGGTGANREIDGVLLLYAANVASLNRLVETEIASMRGVASVIECRIAQAGPSVIPQGRVIRGNVGHFGFVDGISQPVIEGTWQDDRLSRREKALHSVPAGDFVLGYADARGARVRYDDRHDPRSRDLARNGTYLVARQLEQDVDGFDRFVEAAARAVYGDSTPRSCAMVAAKLVGRRADGTPLVPPPVRQATKDEPGRNDFLYAREDADGLGCPLGAHVRRANPRDVMTDEPETALRLSKMHRILRRGRPYGLLKGALPAQRDTSAKGLFFICLNASIANQFEMVQHTWINNPAFMDLDGEIDPLSHAAAGTFTIQARPSNIRLRRDTPFVTVRGGAYFFMPGVNALRQLCA